MTFRRILAFTLFALANRCVAIRRHHRHRLERIRIQQRTHVANRLLKKPFVRIAKLALRTPRFKITLSSVESKPLRVLFKHPLIIRHGCHAMRLMIARIVANPEPHRPHRRIVPGIAETEIEFTERKVRQHRLLNLRQWN